MNARANAVDVKVSCASMVDEDVDADIVLVGDVFDSRSAAGTALPVLDRAAAHGARVLVGDSGRADLPRGRLPTLATYRAAHSWPRTPGPAWCTCWS
jgi:predicted nicotinamide N-methyase